MLAPAYMINSMISKIPLLGDIIVGGEDQAVFAANFRIRGPSSDPKVSVNPKGGRYGLANACVGGGQGIATIIEREP